MTSIRHHRKAIQRRLQRVILLRAAVNQWHDEASRAADLLNALNDMHRVPQAALDAMARDFIREPSYGPSCAVWWRRS